MKKLLLSTGAIAALTFGTAATAATVAVDTFADDQGVVIATGGAMVSDTQLTANAIGGARTIEVTNISGPFESSGATSAMDDGRFFFSNDAGTQGIASLSYFDAAGADLSGGGVNTEFLIDIVAIDLNMLVSVSFDGVSSSQMVMDDGDLVFDFADYAGVDFTSVNDIIVTFDSNGIDAVDAIVDFVGAVGAPIPLPAGGLLLLTALGGVAVARRKQR